MGVRAHWDGWLNAGFDPAITPAQTLRRARSVVAGVTATLLFGPPYIYLYVRLGAFFLAAWLFASLLLCSWSLFVLRRGRAISLAASVALTALAAACFAINLASGGFYDVTFAGLCMLPLGAFGWLGRRAGIAWTVGLMVLATGLWWASDAAWLEALHSGPLLAHASQLALVNRLAAVLGIALLAGTLTSSHERSEARLVLDTHTLQAEVDESREAHGLAVREAEAQARFAATLSHELRTPMTAALSSVDILLESELSRPQRELVSAIGQAGQAMLSVIRDVLDYSKLQAGALPLNCREFSPRSLLEGAGQMLAPQAHGKGIELVLRLSAQLPERVFGDEARLRQIVLNLLGNALKFTREGEVLLEASFAGDTLTVAVTDSGVGMTEQEMRRLFEPFNQASSARTAAAPGTGLGLTIARSFARHMGGDIRVSAAPNRGSTFVLEVQLEQVATHREAPARLDVERVLVVDDHAAAGDALGALLSELHIDWQLAKDADDALRMLDAQPFDRVLCDAHLPADDTQRVLDAAASRVVTLRAPGTRERTTNGAEIASLSKPVTRESLICVLRQTGSATVARSRARSHSAIAVRDMSATAALPEVAPGLAPAYWNLVAGVASRNEADRGVGAARSMVDSVLSRSVLGLSALSSSITAGEVGAVHQEARSLSAGLAVLGLNAECERCSELMALELPADRERAKRCVDQIDRCLRAIDSARTNALSTHGTRAAGARPNDAQAS